MASTTEFVYGLFIILLILQNFSAVSCAPLSVDQILTMEGDTIEVNLSQEYLERLEGMGLIEYLTNNHTRDMKLFKNVVWKRFSGRKAYFDIAEVMFYCNQDNKKNCLKIKHDFSW